MSALKGTGLFGPSFGQPMDYFERRFRRSGFHHIAGIDEAGRGPLAGPVVAAAVILPLPEFDEPLADSKTLSVETRERLCETILERAVSVGIGLVEADEIDRTDIARATQRAMATAVERLLCRPDMLLVDGIVPVPVLLPQRTIVKGDSLSLSIAAASIVAKVTRDRIMMAYHERFPEYNFAAHKGYGTREHRRAIRKYGYCEIHRKTFNGVADSPSETTDPRDDSA